MDALQALKQAITQLLLTNGIVPYWVQAPIGQATPYTVFKLTNDIITTNSNKEMHNFVIHFECVADDSATSLANYSYLHLVLQNVILYLGSDWQNFYARRIRQDDSVRNVEGNALYVASGYYEYRVVKGE